MTDKWVQYEKLVLDYERQGMTTGDAQGVADVVMMQAYGMGWEINP